MMSGRDCRDCRSKTGAETVDICSAVEAKPDTIWQITYIT